MPEASIEVLTEARRLPPVRLTRRPSAPRSGRLSDVLDALLGARAHAHLARTGDALHVLAALAGGPQAPPAARPGDSAAFLMLRPQGVADAAATPSLEELRLDAVWLHGIELAGPQ